MLRKKWTVNAVAIALFLLLSLTYLMILLQLANISRTKAIRFHTDATAGHLENHFDEWREEAEWLVNHPELASGAEAGTGIRYGRTSKSGTFTLEGLTLPGLISPTLLQEVVEQGYSVIITDHKSLGGFTAMVLFSPGLHETSYLTAVQPLEAFARRMAGQITLPLERCILVDPTGNVWASRNGDGSWQLETGWELPFRLNTAPLSAKRAQQVTLPLLRPSGWTLKGWVSPSALLPGFPLLFCSALGVFGLLLALFVTMQRYNEIHRSKEYRRFLSTMRRDSTIRPGSPEELENSFLSFSRSHVMKHYSLVCMDFSNFHRFNDTFGYETGDEVLRITEQYVLKKYHCGIRLYSDVFLFIAPTSPTLPKEIRETLNEAVKHKVDSRVTRSLACRFGIYPLVDDPQTFRDAYDGAILALQQAKQTRKREVEVIYDEDMRSITQLHRNIEYYMLYALNNKEFQLYVQPKFLAADNGFCGGEALIRWDSRQMGFLSPAYFIPLFEQNGFVAEIDFFMLQSALDLLQGLMDNNKKLFTLSVNQSRITISYPNYLERLQDLVFRYTVPLHFIELEITESALTQDFEAVISLVEELRQMGFCISMDDFGTGYSSLNTLRLLPVDTLKLDKDFLHETDHTQRGNKIIQSIISMARDLEISTICEGVETGLQLDFLRDIGCDMIQGYFLAKPMPGREFIDRFAETA